jgi:hypothetical protein
MNWQASAGAARNSRTRARRRRQHFPIRVSYPAKTQPVISQPQGWRYVCGTSPTFPDDRSMVAFGVIADI